MSSVEIRALRTETESLRQLLESVRLSLTEVRDDCSQCFDDGNNFQRMGRTSEQTGALPCNNSFDVDCSGDSRLPQARGDPASQGEVCTSSCGHRPVSHRHGQLEPRTGISSRAPASLSILHQSPGSRSERASLDTTHRREVHRDHDVEAERPRLLFGVAQEAESECKAKAPARSSESRFPAETRSKGRCKAQAQSQSFGRI